LAIDRDHAAGHYGAGEGRHDQTEQKQDEFGELHEMLHG
jgi:hypothetical protein